MDYLNRQPPDFAGWKFKYQKSLFLDFKTGKVVAVAAKEVHPTRKNWLGYKCEYFNQVGFAQGRVFNVLGRGEVLKFWGLRAIGNNDRYELFSIFYNGVWLTFSNNDYRRIWGFYGKENRIITGVSITVCRKTEEAKASIYKIKVMKNPPPFT